LINKKFNHKRRYKFKGYFLNGFDKRFIRAKRKYIRSYKKYNKYIKYVKEKKINKLMRFGKFLHKKSLSKKDNDKKLLDLYLLKSKNLLDLNIFCPRFIYFKLQKAKRNFYYKKMKNAYFTYKKDINYAYVRRRNRNNKKWRKIKSSNKRYYVFNFRKKILQNFKLFLKIKTYLKFFLRKFKFGYHFRKKKLISFFLLNNIPYSKNYYKGKFFNRCINNFIKKRYKVNNKYINNLFFSKDFFTFIKENQKKYLSAKIMTYFKLYPDKKVFVYEINNNEAKMEKEKKRSRMYGLSRKGKRSRLRYFYGNLKVRTLKNYIRNQDKYGSFDKFFLKLNLD